MLYKRTYSESIAVYFRGRHASKVTEEEEDEEYLKEEEDGMANTRLVTQPSCKLSFFVLNVCILAWVLCSILTSHMCLLPSLSLCT